MSVVKARAEKKKGSIRILGSPVRPSTTRASSTGADIVEADEDELLRD